MDIINIFNNNSNSNNNNNQENVKYKYLLLGDSLISLYKIIKLFIEGDYNEGQLESTSVTSLLPQLSYREGTFNNKLVRMEVIFDSRITRDIIYSIDKNIQEFFNCFNAFIIVYDTTDIDSFNSLADWIDVINQFTNNSNNSNKIFLVGENCNKRSERKVSIEQVRNFAINNSCCGFIEVSTRDNKNIDNLFIELTNILINDSNLIQNQYEQLQQQYPPPKLSPIPKDSILDSLFKVSVISASIIGLIYFLKSK